MNFFMKNMKNSDFGTGSGSTFSKCGSEDPDPDPLLRKGGSEDPDPDPRQNEMDPKR